MSERFNVVVVGAGPGGIAAATVAAEAGKRVCLLDDNAAPGGQVWRGLCAGTARKQPHGSRFLAWISRLERSGCAVWPGWQAVDYPAPGILRLERNGETQDLAFDRLILATGARERFLPFPGWTLPGVMGAGGLQAMVKAGLNPSGKRVVVAGSGPLLLAVAAALGAAGAQIAGIYEQAPLRRLLGLGLTLLGRPGKLAEGVRYRLKTLPADYRVGSWVAQAEGRGRLEQVTVTNGRKEQTLKCDWLACGFHLVPNLELPRLLGCRIAAGYVAVDALQQSSVPGVACVGELTGVGGLEKALIEGRTAGWVAAGHGVHARILERRRHREQSFALRLDQAFDPRAELRDVPAAETVVCRCEDVTHGAAAGCNSWREAKLHTRCGMGACQGRVCGAATEFLYGWGPAEARPPAYPVWTSTLAAEIDSANSMSR